MKAKLVKKEDHYFLEVEPYTLSTIQRHTIIANTFDKPEGHVLQLSLKNCQAIERGYDLDELVEEELKDVNKKVHQDLERDGWIKIGLVKGFQKALELMETEIKQLREFTKGFAEDWDFDGGWNCIVEMEYIGKCNGNNGDGCFQESPGHNCGCFERTTKLDADGCLILKRI